MVWNPRNTMCVFQERVYLQVLDRMTGQILKSNKAKAFNHENLIEKKKKKSKLEFLRNITLSVLEKTFVQPCSEHHLQQFRKDCE